MANTNFNGVQINQSSTIVEQAGEKIKDCRNRFMVYNANGNVALAVDGTKPIVGVALIESGLNDISGRDSGMVEAGGDVDIQIKDIGYVLAGAEISKGIEITAGEGGLAVPAKAGEYVAGIALAAAEENNYCRVQISKYQKGSAASK